MEKRSDSRFRLQDWYYDKIYGIETKGYIHLKNRKGYKNYLPTKYLALRKLFKKLQVNNNDYVVDFGCGLGRVSFYASIAGCGKVLGVEINPLMYNMAKKNLSNFEKKTKAYNVEIVKMDATELLITEDMNIFYFYTPFEVEHFQRVVDNILQSKQKYDRKMTIVTCNTHDEYKKYLDNIKVKKTSYYIRSIDGFYFNVYVIESQKGTFPDACMVQTSTE